MVLAIDGPAGVGKSTLAKHLAEKFNFTYLNTGRFYRAVTYLALTENLFSSSPETPAFSEDSLANFSVNLQEKLSLLAQKTVWDFDETSVVANGVRLAQELHTKSVDAWVAQVSALVPVRAALNAQFRAWGQKKNLVVEGRDMTSEVFPQAEVRLFLDATPEARATRRFEERPEGQTYEQILQSIRQRDAIDRSKPVGALRLTPGCLLIETSHLTIKAVYEKVDAIVENQREQLRSVSQATAETENNQTLLQEEYLKSLDNLQEGSLVEGTVISVSSDSVSVGIGYKSDGIIPLSEFKEAPQVGSSIRVILVKKESKNGGVELSRSKAEAIVFKDELKSAFEEKKPLSGKFTKVIKGGYEVDLGHGYHGFVPLSKADLSRVENPDELLGVAGQFLVEKLVWDKSVNIVLNRRDLMVNETESKRKAFFENHKEGDVIEGEVKTFTSFGAFLDLGGFDGLLHINDMSWGHAVKPKDYVQKGDKIKVKLVKLDPVEKKINLSLKHMADNPWTIFEKKYKVGDVVKGTVTKLADFGAFVEIEDGIEGLVHVSEMSWIKRISHPKELLKAGDVIEVKILAYDLANTRLSLGLKQVTTNPWEDMAASFPIGKVLTLPVKKVTPAGAFITLQDGVDGFLHVDDLSWTKKVRNATSELKDGQMIDVKILEVDKDAKRIRLGVKQITDDPWNSLRKAYPRGSAIEGVITSKTEFGVFVRVPGDIEGLIPKSGLCDTRDQSADDFMKTLNVGDKLKVLVMEVNAEKQKLSLSLRDYVKQVQKEEISKYIQDDDDHSSFRLGDLLKK